MSFIYSYSNHENIGSVHDTLQQVIRVSTKPQCILQSSSFLFKWVRSLALASQACEGDGPCTVGSATTHPDCQTSTPGQKCIFPWTYPKTGKTYDGCTSDDSFWGDKWCPTKLNDKGEFVDSSNNDDEWAYCRSGCPDADVGPTPADG